MKLKRIIIPLVSLVALVSCNNTNQPNNTTTNEPTSSTDVAPTDSTNVIPTNSTDTQVLPTDSTDKPVESTNTPIDSTDKPVVSTDTGVDTTVDTTDIIDDTVKLQIKEAVAYNEGAYLTWDVSASDSESNYEVSYKVDNKDVKLDQELIRIENNVARADILGLKAGNYTFSIKQLNTKDVVTSNALAVVEDDRSGYAHFNNKDGVGAYKNDGTLKDNAIVVYVNDKNKNTVEATVNGEKRVGLVNIIKAAKNSNESLDVRIIGEIQTQQWNYKAHGTGSTKDRMDNLDETFSQVNWEETTANELKNPDTTKSSSYYKISEADILKYNINSFSDDIKKGITHLDGLTNNILKNIEPDDKSGYLEYDSYYNELDVRGGNNITIEGVGANAKIFQWGFCFNQCNSIEVKNIEFSDYTEDAIGIQGAKDVTLHSSYWIHNCTFNQGKNNWDVCYENDKNEGDGSTDFKSAHDLTISYCRYNNTHKTALIGSGSSSYQYNITFHHNFYNSCGSRLPFTRNSNIHIYNCYYYKSTGTNMQINNTAYTFIERCYFEKTNKTFTTSDGGVIKLYKNIVDATSSITPNNTYYVTNRTDLVTNTCMPDQKTDYSTFDTNKDLFYYDDVNNITKVQLMHKEDDIYELIPTIAGAGLNVALDYSKNVEETNDTPVTPTKENATYTESIPTQKGIYGKVLTYELDNNNKAISSTEAIDEYSTTNVVTIDSNNTISIVDNANNKTTFAYYMFENTYTTGTHTYKLDLSLNGVGSKWSIITLLDGNNNIAIRSCGLNSSDAKKWGYSIDGGKTEVASTLAVESSKTYTIVITIDYDNKIATLKINDTTINIEGWTFNQINGIQFMTAISATDRSFNITSVEVK